MVSQLPVRVRSLDLQVVELELATKEVKLVVERVEVDDVDVVFKDCDAELICPDPAAVVDDADEEEDAAGLAEVVDVALGLVVAAVDPWVESANTVCIEKVLPLVSTSTCWTTDTVAVISVTTDCTAVAVAVLPVWAR